MLDALNAAECRGVAIRIVLDPRERHDFVKLGDLSDTVRIKRGGPFMHLKAYEIDGAVLRTGSANFSTSGENAQDNDLIVIRDAVAAIPLFGLTSKIARPPSSSCSSFCSSKARSATLK